MSSTDILARDARDAIRGLRGTLRLSLIAVACIAVGMGGALFILTIANGVLLRPPPFADADRLVRIWAVASGAASQSDVSYLESRDVADRVRSFDRLESVTRTRLALTVGETTERLRGEAVTAGYFDLISARPVAGRLFTAAEYAPDAPAVIILGYDLWQRKFGGRQDVVGQIVRARGTTGRDSDRLFTVIGVLPPRFVGTVDPDISEFWLPIAQYLPRRVIESRTARSTWVLARLRPGSTLAGAQAELTRVQRELAVTHPAPYRGVDLSVEPVGESWRSRFRGGLGLLAGTAILLLLIAAANVGHLLLARLAQREREFRIRLALGASRMAIVRQLFVESLALAGVGGAAGAVLGIAAVRTFAASGVFPLPPYVSLEPDTRVIAAALALVVIVAILSGVFPAWLGSRLDGAFHVRDGRASTLGKRQGRSVQAMVVAEVAISFLLLAGSGLMLRTYANLLTEDMGFRTDGLLRLAISLDASEFRSAESVLAFADATRRDVGAVPGVAGVSVMAGVLPPWSSDDARLGVNGTPIAALSAVDQHPVDEHFFDVMAIPLVAGRSFGPSEARGGERVAVVSRTLARALFGDERRAVNRTFEIYPSMQMQGAATATRVIGVVEDVKYRGPLGARAAQNDLYLPLAQAPDPVLSIAVSTDGDPNTVRTAAIRALGGNAPTSPVHWVSTMKEELRLQFGDARLYAWTTAVFGFCALSLVAIGIFGVLSNAVARRVAEIGVRMAVGATPWRIRALVIAQAARPVALGLVIGVVAAATGTQVMRGLIYGVTPADPVTLAGVALSLVAIAMVSSYLPARRATRVDPATVLRRG